MRRALSPARTELPTYRPIVEQPRGFDLLRLPGLRRFVRWKYARLVFQIPLLLLAIFAIVDGFTGRQLAPRNVATTSVWLHYRGLVVIALALVGNAFCAACPLMLTRGATRRIERWLPRKFAWPSALKSKVFVTVLLVVYFFAYEYFGLWASPWLTAWLIVGYFGAALAIDALFSAGTFCRYVCPLGNFNFTFASASPTQVTAVDHDVCRSCEHKPCLHGRTTYDSPTPPAGADPGLAFIPLAAVTRPNGQGRFPGCETDLFVPTMQSNMDCTSCFNCVRACPYDNVAVTVRSPGWEWLRDPWAKRGRLAVVVMGVALAWWGLLNAVAMIGPWFQAAEWTALALGTRSEALILGIFFAATTALGFAATLGAAWLGDRLGGARTGAVTAFLRWGYVTVALGFGFWGAHYLFHFLTGALSIVPVFGQFFASWGAPLDPNWRLAQFVPTRWLFPITAAITSAYTLLAAYTAVRIALRDFGRRGAIVMWPMLIYVLVFGALSLWILGQPMEMRGTIFGPGF